jgi:hypothetical protein
MSDVSALEFDDVVSSAPLLLLPVRALASLRSEERPPEPAALLGAPRLL